MITHVVAIRWKPEMPAEHVELIRTSLVALVPQIDSILSYHCGPDLGVGAGNADFSVVATFADLDGWRAYSSFPEHVRVRDELMVPWIADRSAVQFASD